MQRISALFHKRQKDGKHYDEDDDCAFSYSTEDSVDGSLPKPPRLMRSPGIRGLRCTEDIKISRLSLNHEGDHALESAFSASNLSSTLPSISRLGSPLPSPPRSPVLSSQAPSLWPLPSPKQFPKKSEDNERRSNGFHMDRLDTANAVPAEGDSYKSSHSSSSTENYHSYSPHLGLPVSSASRIGGKPHGSSGAGILPYPLTKQSDSSGANEWISSSLTSPKDSRTHHEPLLWTSDQPIYGDRVAADEFATEEHNHNPRSHLQNGSISKHSGYPSRDSQAIGSPIVASPPLSPSSARTVIPGGWIKGQLLGSGAFGRVYKGIHSGTGEFCAIKEVEFVQSDHRSKESAEQLKKEIASLSSLKHPNIVQYKGSELMGDKLYIYLELISGGSLYKLYQEFKKLEEPVIRRYTRQILFGLAYLHGRKFVHRDIKCANILVDQDGTIKLADFGVSKYIKEQGVPFSLKGSPQWMAPEVIMSTNTGHEYAVDIWSLGCTVLEMVMGRPPWCDLEPAAAMFKIINRGAPPIPDTLSGEGRSFVRLCLQRNPADRPTAAALLEHPFVKMQSEAHHNVVHAFEALNNVLEYGEVPLASLGSSAVGAYSSLSAPSSPRSSYRPMNDSNYTQESLQVHRRGVAHSTYVESRMPMTDFAPQRRLKVPKPGIRPTEQRQSHEFSQKQDRPSLSAPVSPKSPHVHGSLYPLRSGEILPGYPTPFTEI